MLKLKLRIVTELQIKGGIKDNSETVFSSAVFEEQDEVLS